MKEKKWIFFRVMVYLGLAVALLSLALLMYYYVTARPGLRSIVTLIVIGIIPFCVQVAFNLLNIRLIYYYLYHLRFPQASFRNWHTFLLILNSCVAVAFICVFLYGFLETFKTNPYHKSPDTEDVVALVMIGTYTFITICTITGAVVLRRYIKYGTTRKEEEWLNQLGSANF